jgi:DNA-binding transcriptional MerR regulator
MVGSGSYTAEQLAFRAGVPLRTIRYYVQEKLIDPPRGRGRGAHFDDAHLRQVQGVRLLQNAGFDLEAIRARAGELTAMVQHVAPLNAALWPALAGPRATSPPHADGELDPRSAIRIPMADGIELLIDRGRTLPSPKVFVDIAMFIRTCFGER